MACGFQCKWCADNRYEMSSRCRFFSSKKKMKMKKKFINYFVKLVPWLKSLKINIRFLKWKRTEEMIWVAWCVPEWRFVEMFGTQWHRGCHRGYVSWTASEKCQRRIHHIHTLPHELKNELGFVAFLFHTHTQTHLIVILSFCFEIIDVVNDHDNKQNEQKHCPFKWTYVRFKRMNVCVRRLNSSANFSLSFFNFQLNYVSGRPHRLNCYDKRKREKERIKKQE